MIAKSVMRMSIERQEKHKKKESRRETGVATDEEMLCFARPGLIEEGEKKTQGMTKKTADP